MWYDTLSERIVNLQSKAERVQLEEFLKKQNLSLDREVEYTVSIVDREKIVATGSLGGRILKCIAVDEEYKNIGLSAKLITHLVREAYSRGKTHLFIYTKPENKIIFSDLGFYPIAEVSSKVILMENKPDGIKKYLKEITRDDGDKSNSGAVIVNCNPFTLGHRHLIEYAASRCQTLHIFVLREDKSSFPFEIRYRLVKEGVKHLANVVLHQGKDYIISDATFPSYFIKDFQDVIETHARLDLELFTRYIAPALGIQKRFVGEEPYCKVTATYNSIMQEILPAQGIEVQLVPRMLNEGRPIGASRVRELIHEGRLYEVKKLVPETTYQFLLSAEAKGIIQRIQADHRRH
ncbi:[citrate (pro-3S)-lyase] ligase [Neobacillus ginsengisoli]|uniref:[Citrate [pro-3S]-lyase] ligase n=1 Tax=Neobacillus ginsengisoli TaxID=904295 RepID=A0ABT9XUN3_9BACI|nr:[citrate (pro-3S)-lyase] ligase [Neobacillus ginsengisoli]MDQ0199282.1 [citrate (pro-3S)-lyase] ligase [Neobacillus ginsengisoli]